MILMVIFVVLMVLWVALGLYTPPESGRRIVAVGSSLIPWACVAILGWVVFNGVPVVVAPR